LSLHEFANTLRQVVRRTTCSLDNMFQSEARLPNSAPLGRAVSEARFQLVVVRAYLRDRLLPKHLLSLLLYVPGMTVEEDAPPAYFAGTSAKFQAAADVQLKLRGGERLPAHSYILASISPLLSDLLEVASQERSDGKIELPFTDFSKREAVAILKVRN